jgi:hypothetical protein
VIKNLTLEPAELSNLNIDLAARLLALSVDITLILDSSGKIESVIDGIKPVFRNTPT